MANANDPSTWPELERVQLHDPGCGCRFLIGWQETRIRTEPEPTGYYEIKDNETVEIMDQAKLHDVIEIHAAMVEEGLRIDLPPEPITRVVTHEEAEQIVSAKRDHEWWDGHVVSNGEQPYPRMCSKHGKLPYNDETYAIVCEEANAAAIISDETVLTKEEARQRLENLRPELEKILAVLNSEIE